MSAKLILVHKNQYYKGTDTSGKEEFLQQMVLVINMQKAEDGPLPHTVHKK